LDVATGSGDIPRALWRWSRQNGIDLDIVACDLSEEVLSAARLHLVGTGVRLARADARALPWRSGQFDVVLSCLALHHFAPSDAVVVLQEMWRVASVAIVVTDLRRGYTAWAATWAATRALTGNRLTHHDGPLSVLRAYTPEELRELAGEAGVPDASVEVHPFFRQGLVALKTGGHSHA
jgi:SAM-dependent methyltransferase